jgi:hypothetical protein
MLRVLSTHHRWGVSGTVITNGLIALKSLAEFLGLQPYADADWWKDHIGSTATNTSSSSSTSSHRGFHRNGSRASARTEDEEEEAAAAATAATAVAEQARLGHLQEFARQHMWRTRQCDTKPMPPQKFLPPCRVRGILGRMN